MKLKKVKYSLYDNVKYKHSDLTESTDVTVEESTITGVQIFVTKYGQKNRYVLSNGIMIEEHDVVRKVSGRGR